MSRKRLVIGIAVLAAFTAGVATGWFLPTKPQLVAGPSVAVAQDTRTPTEATRVTMTKGLPGGKPYYVVSVASESQARLAYVTFVADGSVSWSGWYWDKNIIDEKRAYFLELIGAPAENLAIISDGTDMVKGRVYRNHVMDLLLVTNLFWR
jgi:hypothetical protein